MENKKSDRRSNRTQQSLRKALKELILEKHYDEITVQNIIDRADVGRSTFYAHFRDKEDLFRGDWERFLGFLVQHIDFENIEKDGFVPIKMLFQHLIDFHPFYRALVKSRKSDRLFRIGQNHLAKAIEKKLTLLPENEQPAFVPISIMANYLANEIFSLLLWWLDQNMSYTPERMDGTFHQLVMPGIRAALADKTNNF